MLLNTKLFTYLLKLFDTELHQKLRDLYVFSSYQKILNEENIFFIESYPIIRFFEILHVKKDISSNVTQTVRS